MSCLSFGCALRSSSKASNEGHKSAWRRPSIQKMGPLPYEGTSATRPSCNRTWEVQHERFEPRGTRVELQRRFVRIHADDRPGRIAVAVPLQGATGDQIE